MFLNVERLWQDVRHGARVFARNPLRPLPVPLPDDLVAVGFRTETMPGVTTINASYRGRPGLQTRHDSSMRRTVTVVTPCAPADGRPPTEG